MRDLQAAIVLVSALVAGLVAPPPGAAYHFRGVKWPGGVVPYFNAAPDQAWAVAEAVGAWNRSGANVRFVAVPRADAKLVIEEENDRVYCGEGHASVGYVRNASVVIFPARGLTHACNRYWAAHLVAHELGHVLGLLHENRYCAAMNESGSMRGGSKCGPDWRWEWRCRLLEPDDVAGVAAIYGGRPRPPATPAVCPLYAAIKTPVRPSVSYDSARPAMTVAFGRPAEPRIPAFVIPVPWKAKSGFLLARTPTCPADGDTSAAYLYRWKAAVGNRQQLQLPAPTRRLCIAIWALDKLGRPSASPARVIVGPAGG
jgi:hypothetical protein